MTIRHIYRRRELSNRKKVKVMTIRLFKRFTGIPYIDNLPLIILTVLINLAAAFLFMNGRLLTRQDILIDAAICGVTTSVINTVLVYRVISKLRSKGELPPGVPMNLYIQKLPKNPWLTGLTFALVFGLATALIAEITFGFFGVRDIAFYRFVAWKVVYSCVLSAKIIELLVLRFVQPDCSKPDDPAQSGTREVKDPLPRRQIYLRIFNTVTTDFGFNMIIGLILGGTALMDGNVVIYPTTRAGIVISGAILGIIVALRMARPVAKAIKALRDEGKLPPNRHNPWIAWLPDSPWLFALALVPVFAVVSPLFFWSVFTFFGFEMLDFFQFFLVRTLYVSLITKPVTALAIAKYRQPIKTKRKRSVTDV